MEHGFPRQFFLGANTGAGFVSLAPAYTAVEDGAFFWYIKGGPGNGKSTLMRRAAERAEKNGFSVEYFLCSGDPDSLDGIYIPEMKLGYLDAISPHIQEPAIPGVSGKYLDIGSFYRTIPPEKGAALQSLFRAYRQEYVRAGDLLNASSLAAPDSIPFVITAETRLHVRDRAEALAKKILRHTDNGYEKQCFLSAYTCRGTVLLSETAASFGDVYTLDNRLGLANDFLTVIHRRAQALGAARIVCYDPVMPQRLAALILPEEGISLVAVSEDFCFSGKPVRHFRLDAAAALSETQRKDIRRSAALRRSLAAEAVISLRRAKELHDTLEEEYRPFVDFRALTRFENRHLESVFSA